MKEEPTISVIDASVACKWYLDEPDSDKARKLAAAEGQRIAPDLILSEVGNTLWRRWRRGEVVPAQIAAVVAHLPSAVTLVASRTLFVRALVIAQAIDHPVYDCFYIAAAERWSAPLITDDQRLLAALKKSEIEVTARPLAAV